MASDVVAMADGRVVIVGSGKDRVRLVWTGDPSGRMTEQVLTLAAVDDNGLAGLVWIDDEVVVIAGATKAGATETGEPILPTWRSIDGITWTPFDARVIDGRGIGLGRPAWDA